MTTDRLDSEAPQTTAEEVVLCVDTDSAARDATVETLEGRVVGVDVAVAGTVSVARELLAERPVGCLVVDPAGLDRVEAMLDAADCPVVLYTALDATTLDPELSDRARTVVEKFTGTDCPTLLAEKVERVRRDGSERATRASLARETVTADEILALVDADDRVTWTSTPLSTLVPGAIDTTAGTLAGRLDPAVPDGDDGQRALARFQGGPDAPVVVPIETSTRDGHLLVRPHDAPPGTGDGRLVAIADVSERVESATRRGQLALLADEARDGLYMLDENGVVDFCNDAFAATLGYDCEQLRGKHAAELLAPGELTTGQRTVEQLLCDPEREQTTVELRFRCADGEERLLSIRYTLRSDADGAYDGLLGAVRDVTERRERERAIEQERALFVSLVEHFPNGGVFLFDDDLRFIEVGGQELAPLGLDAEEMIGRRPAEIFPPENARVLEECYRAAVEGEHTSFEDTYQDNRYHVQTIPLPDNDVAAGMAVAQNVTEQRERQWELERSNTLLSTLLDSLPLGILVEDSGREISTVNQRFLDMFELLGTPEDIVGRDCVAHARDVRDLFADETAFVEDVAAVPADRPVGRTRELELQDGRIFERSGVPVDLPGGRGWLWLYQDVTDRVNHERELAETSERLDLALEGAELGIWDWDFRTDSITRNDRWATMLGYEPGEITDGVGEWVQRVHPEDRDRAEAELAAHFAGETDYYQCEIRLQTESGEYRWIRDSGKVFEWDEDGDPVRAVGIHQDITERKRQKRELRRQRDELELLAQIHSLIQDVIRALGAAASREEIEEIVCRRLVDSDLYRFAWIGEREGGDNRLATRTMAGDDDGYLDIVRERATATDRERGPATAALTTGEVQVVRDVTDEPTMVDWADTAVERGYRSAVTVPLVHNEVVHGVLVVYAGRPDAFSDRAVESFTVLGEMVGFALTAVQNRQLLARDTVLELTYRVEDDPLVAAAGRADCRIEVVGSVDVDEGVLQYLRVFDGEPGTLLDAVRREGGAVDGRVVASEGTSGVVELTTPGGFESALLDVGARLQSVAVTPTELLVTVEAPTDADPRTIREAIATRAADAELTARHERTGPPPSSTDDPTMTDSLTDRQREVLRAAYLAGYYAWPRDTTAEQLSETLGIASPTLHQHLRRAQRNLLGALFEE